MHWLRVVGVGVVSGAVVTGVEIGQNTRGPHVFSWTVAGRVSLAIYLRLVARC